MNLLNFHPLIRPLKQIFLKSQLSRLVKEGYLAALKGKLGKTYFFIQIRSSSLLTSTVEGTGACGRQCALCKGWPGSRLHEARNPSLGHS